MKCDTLARRAILFVAFIAATTILYGLTTRLLFTAPNYDDVSIDPEGGSYYDYGSKVAAAVWKGAGQWMGMSSDGSVNTETTKADIMVKSKEHGEDIASTASGTLDPEETFAAIANQENKSRERRRRPRRVRTRTGYLGH
ncbi:hypothetical protein D6D01_07420 [Aureobasidium pullulans]|uniref:Uncharacterized protein n=1 Tax=Aureobasidium pullulans TaxID=5580 RepID=A0A4V6TEL9_AURPU|nr:hypothetical protein D6D01_07420 [Aureobasidium pullulans]